MIKSRLPRRSPFGSVSRREKERSRRGEIAAINRSVHSRARQPILCPGATTTLQQGTRNEGGERASVIHLSDSWERELLAYGAERRKGAQPIQVYAARNVRVAPRRSDDSCEETT